MEKSCALHIFVGCYRVDSCDAAGMDPKPSWAECVEAARQTRQYVEICLQTLCAPAATLPPERKAAKDDFEWKQPLHVLKPLREVCCCLLTELRVVPYKLLPLATAQIRNSGCQILSADIINTEIYE